MTNLRKFGGGGTYRLNEIDAMKGIGIILMVMGHCGFPYTHWIFLFHMALFFVISGFCWNDKHSDSWESAWTLIRKRTRDLYLPYVICNLAFLLLTNVFIKLNLYTDNQLFIESLGNNIGNNVLTHSLSIRELLYNAVAIVLLVGGTQLGGPTWFFGTLYLITVGHVVLSYLAHKISRNKKQHRFISFCIFVIVAGLVKIISMDSFFMPLRSVIGRVLIGYFAYLMGVGIRVVFSQKEISLKPIYYTIIAVTSFTVLIIMDRVSTVSIATAKITSVWSFVICSVAGVILVFSVSSVIPEKLQIVLGYIGRHTRPIVCIHMICFKIVTSVIIFADSLPKYMLASFPTLDTSKSWMWIVYSAAGISIPLLLDYVIRTATTRINSQCTSH